MREELTKKEKAVLSYLAKAWDLYTELEEQHPDDSLDFRRALHECQRVVGFKLARRVHPTVFPFIIQE